MRFAARFSSRPARSACFLACALYVALATGCGTGEDPADHRLQGQTMGTGWSLVIPGRVMVDVEALQQDLETRLVEINSVMSTWDPASDLSRINADPRDEWLPVPVDLLEVMAAAGELNQVSEGGFDVTVGPLVDLWGFGAGSRVTQAELPTEAAIAAARQRLGAEGIELRADPPAMRRSAEVRIDLSAIAKGYAVDELARIIESHGVRDYLVEIGGELRGAGRSSRGDAWRVGVEVPQPDRRGLVRRAVALDGGGIATSGDYRNFFLVDGVRYSHTIDPKTGRPVHHDVASVTVLHPSAMWADGWATALNVLGAERGMEIALAHELPVLFILHTPDGLEEVASPAFENWRSRSNR